MGVNHLTTQLVPKVDVQLGNNNFVVNTTFTSAVAGVVEAGTVVGRLKTTGKLVIINPADATNGSCFPVGVITDPITAVIGDNLVTIVTSGRINADALIFPVGTTLDTVVENRQLRDYFITGGYELIKAHL